VVLLSPEYDENGLPERKSLLALYDRVNEQLRSGQALAAYTPERGGAAAAIMKMAFGNGLGFRFDPKVPLDTLFADRPGRFLLEVTAPVEGALTLGETTEDFAFVRDAETVEGPTLQKIFEDRLEGVYPCNIPTAPGPAETFSFSADDHPHARIQAARPRVLIPVFPGTNCEYDSAKAVRDAGGEPVVLVLNNLTPAGIVESTDRFSKALKTAQMVFIPGGFSGGDEPDGSGKFITAFFRSGAVADGVHDLLDNRDGLMLGICNGFQALIKLGLVPYGKITAPSAYAPTLTYNTIGRHQSRLVRTRVASNNSPWLMETSVGDVFTVPISHGEGRFLCGDDVLKSLIANGQVATQYVALDGQPTDDILFNPNGSVAAIEGILSPDGRVLGKMGHSERIDAGLYQNVPGNYDMGLFRSAKRYYE
jgi:phosphoribosylformylglycinamidine synthase